MLDTLFKYPRVLDRLRDGPFGGEMDGLAAHLTEVGYAPASARVYLSRIARFGRFAARAGHTGPTSITWDVGERFIRESRTPSARAGRRTAVGHVLRYVQARCPQGPGQEALEDPDALLIARYDEYLSDVRGLQPRTREGMLRAARRVLAWYGEQRSGQPLSGMTGQDVLDLVGYLLELCRTDRTRSATVSHVRSFLKYLRWAEVVGEDLARLAPRTPSWSRPTCRRGSPGRRRVW